MKDYAVAAAPGKREPPLYLHRVDCVLVREQARLGDPVLNLYGCEREPRANVRRCICLGG